MHTSNEQMAEALEVVVVVVWVGVCADTIEHEAVPASEWVV